MKALSTYSLSFFLLLLLFSPPAFAAIDPLAADEGVLSVAAATPSLVGNGSATIVEISGLGFTAEMTVSLDGALKLSSEWISATLIRASLPPQLPPAVYTIVVAQKGGPEASLPHALTVFGPTAVQPNQVSNAVNTQLVVTGVGFIEGAVVILDDYGALETGFVSSNVLHALLPSGAPPRVYTIRVVNPDASSAALEEALTVTAPEPTPQPSATPQPSVTPAPTATPQPTAFLRPLLVVQSYGASASELTPGEALDFEMTLANAGQATANNVAATFVAGDLMARATGGVRALGALTPGQASRFWQPLSASADLKGKSVAVMDVRVSYTDLAGTAYEETFSLTFPVVRQATGGVAATATPTPTPTYTPQLRPQLLVTSYETDIPALEPGQRFILSLEVLNEGDADARRVTLVVGGGIGDVAPAQGTPPPGGGLDGAGGTFTDFAPVGSSNISFLGDLATGASLPAQVELIVNATTKPGAYPLVISFVYYDRLGGTYVDEQIITLLVYSSPAVEVNFYTEPAPLFTGQPGPLPIQVINVGKNTVVLGTMSVMAEGAQLMNNSIFVGSLEAGGYFPLDALAVAEAPGPLALMVRVGYTDDFNQPQVISKTLTVEVLEAAPVDMPPEETGDGESPSGPGGLATSNQSWRQQLWRFILGMIGLSSAPLEPAAPAAAGDGIISPEGLAPGPGLALP